MTRWIFALVAMCLLSQEVPARNAKPAKIDSGANSAACKLWREDSLLRQRLRDTVDSINARGKARKAQCLAMDSASRVACLLGLEPMRERLRVFGRDSIGPVVDSMFMHKPECSVARKADLDSLERLKRMADKFCEGGSAPDPVRCEEALFGLADGLFSLDREDSFLQRRQFERDYARWKNHHGLD